MIEVVQGLKFKIDDQHAISGFSNYAELEINTWYTVTDINAGIKAEITSASSIIYIDIEKLELLLNISPNVSTQVDFDYFGNIRNLI